MLFNSWLQRTVLRAAAEPGRLSDVRTLYFDIDGTLRLGDGEAVKKELGEGKCEGAARSAGLERLVCVGSFASIPETVRKCEP